MRQGRMNYTHPFADEPVDLAISTYADDLGKRITVLNSPKQCIEPGLQVDAAIDVVMARCDIHRSIG